MNRIKELRKERKLSQSELADLLNISQQAISFYENGQREPDLDILNKLANFFDVSTDYIIGRTDIKATVNNTKLTRRDEREIEKILEQTKQQLQNAEGLMFSGQPATPEAIQSILDSMKIGMELAKQRNKEKYTPKKYRKKSPNKDKE